MRASPTSGARHAASRSRAATSTRLVYDADRPELPQGRPVAVGTVAPATRSRSARTRPGTSPSPSIGVVLGTTSRSWGYTIGNDVHRVTSRGRTRSTCRRPRSTPPLRTRAGGVRARGLGRGRSDTLTIRDDRMNRALRGATSTARMKRSFPDLVSGSSATTPCLRVASALTGTGLVPPNDFTLPPGHVVEIDVPNRHADEPRRPCRRPAREERRHRR